MPLCLLRAASQVLDVSTNAPRVLIASCSGIILVRFEQIDLIFIFIKVYDGIHNSLLAVSILRYTGQLFLLLTCVSTSGERQH